MPLLRAIALCRKSGELQGKLSLKFINYLGLYTFILRVYLQRSISQYLI